MSPIMDRLLRKAPYPEWVLMYRLGLGRNRIAALVRVAPATVGYHLGVARRQDPGLEAAHHSAARTALSPGALARMEDIIMWITSEDRFPRSHSQESAERSMAAWLRQRRHEAATGTLHPAYRDGLALIPDWDTNTRTAADEARWRDRFAELVSFRAEGNDWPRHRGYASEQEHRLGVWIHSQRQKHHNGALNREKATRLDDAVPGWQTGRTRGRRARL